MVKVTRFSKLEIAGHIWVFGEPQFIEQKQDGDTITLKAVLPVWHEIDMPHSPLPVPEPPK